MRAGLVAACAALALAGCIQAAAPDSAWVSNASSPAARFEDAEGDAREASLEGLAAFAADYACGLLDAPCEGALPQGGDAAPHFDIVAASFDGETQHDLRFSLEIASIPEGFAALAAPPFHRAAYYDACFRPAEGGFARCATAQVFLHEAQPRVQASFTLFDDSCNEWQVCAWAVPARVAWGEPARIEFDVPKALAYRPGDPPRVESLSAAARWEAYNPALPRWHAAVTVHDAQLGHQHQHVVPSEWSQVADTLEPQPVRIDVTPSWTLLPHAGPEIVAEPGLVFGEGTRFDVPGMDLLDADLSEDDAGNLVLRMTLAGLPERPHYTVQHMLIFGVEGKDTYEMGWLNEGGRQYGYAGHCISFACQGDHEDGFLARHDETDHRVVEAPFTLEAGSPATLEIQAPLSAFPRIVAGDRTSHLWLVTQYAEASHYWGSYGSDTHGDVHEMHFVDERVGGAVHVFERGNAEDAGSHEH